jgi:hypothetical protein
VSTVAQLAVAATSFAVVAAIAYAAPRALRSASPLVVGIAAGVAVAASIAADGAASGADVYDAVLRVLAGLAFVAAGCYCSSRARLISAAVLAIASLLGSGGAWPAAAALGISLAAVLLEEDGPALGAVTGLALGQGALRLDWPSVTGVSALIGVVAFLVIAVPALAHVHRRTRRVIVVGTVVLIGVAFVLGVIWGGTALTVRNDLSRAVDAANAGLDAARAGDTELAASHLDEAEALFARAQDRLDAWWAQPIRAVPIASQNARALRVMTDAGRELAETGADTARSADPDDVKPRNGTVPLDEVRALDAPLSTAADALARARTDLADIDSPWLVGLLAKKLDTLDEKVARGARDAETARLAVEVVPKMLGGEGDRRYFVAFQTPAELRSDGGLIGNFAEITYSNGDISLTRNARDSDWNRGSTDAPRTLTAPEEYKRRYGKAHPENTIQNVTLSPDFPSVAQVIEGVYPQTTGGNKVDGVISMDPIALGQFLRLTGPVRVPGYNVELTSDNTADILLQQQYLMFPDSGVRAEFLKAVVRAVFDRLETTELPGPKEIGNILGPMVREGRLQLHSSMADEQAFFRRIGAAREFPDPTGDFLGVVTLNGTGNKIDVFQHRAVDYDARVDPSTGTVEATATIAVRNDAPASGLPDYIIGSYPNNPLPRGTSRVLLWVYSPNALESATLDGQPVDLITQQELGHNVYMAQFDVPPGGTRTLALHLRGGIDLQRYDGEYRLKVWRQATVNPDRTRVAVTAPEGWTVEPVKGLRPTATGAATTVDQSELLAVSAAFAGN